MCRCTCNTIATMLSDDTKQRLKSILALILTGFKTMVATLLSIFVHQVCEPSPDIPEPHECTMTENVTDLTSYNTGVLAFNFITLGAFVGMYILEFYRENWCIKHLDIDPRVANTHLRDEIKAYPVIESQLKELNTHYARYAVVLLVLNITNAIISAILVSYYYGGYKTVTSFLTNVILVADKLYACLYISRTSVKDTLPYSAYMKDYVIYNTIDADIKQSAAKAQDVHVEVS